MIAYQHCAQSSAQVNYCQIQNPHFVKSVNQAGYFTACQGHRGSAKPSGHPFQGEPVSQFG
jgi:hypothetical protein